MQKLGGAAQQLWLTSARLHTIDWKRVDLGDVFENVGWELDGNGSGSQGLKASERRVDQPWEFLNRGCSCSMPLPRPIAFECTWPTRHSTGDEHA